MIHYRKNIAWLLLIFLGGLGAHKFYLGKPGIGIAYMFTFGFMGMGPLIDVFTLNYQVKQANRQKENDMYRIAQQRALWAAQMHAQALSARGHYWS